MPVTPVLLLADLTEACGDSPGLVCRWVFDRTGSTDLAAAASWLVNKPIRVLGVLLFAWLINRLAKRTINRFVESLANETDAMGSALVAARRAMRVLPTKTAERVEELTDRTERSKQRVTTLGAVLRSIASATIWTFALLIIMGEIGINLGPLIAGAGIAGLAVGFGAQTLVRDFLAGIFIIIEDQYGVGDVVDIGPATGTIERVTLRTTRLRDVEGVLWVVPNGEIHRVGNKSQLWARAILDVGVGYSTDLDRAVAVIEEVAVELWREQLPEATIIERPEVWGVQDLGDSAIAIRLAVKTEPAEQWQTARLLRARLKQALDEAGIEIPFPQRTVWMRSEADQGVRLLAGGSGD